jgi:hypothetical protein
MAPYRAHRDSAPQPAAPTTGLVADMVRQFADPYAFLRELVQNGIDAGARSIEVRVERSLDAVITISVTDDGSGMTPEVIQGPLLTLFESSKEGDTSKIGKYGVGFVSVFALEPDEVQVITWRDGGSWLVRLLKDHSYELTETGPREGSGTTVALVMGTGGAATNSAVTAAASGTKAGEGKTQEELRAAALAQHLLGQGTPAPESPLAEHEARTSASLRTWCRHARCPIHLTVIDHGSREEPRRTRVDTAIGVVAPFTVEEASDDEVYVVGTSAGTRHLEGELACVSEPELGESFAGFYNRGLMLYETQHPLSEDLIGIRFKVMSRHLQHTLSRDNVKRDESFERVIERVRAIVKGALREKLLIELARRAERVANGEGEKAYAAVLEAALSPVLALEPSEVALPLTDPVGGSVVLHGLDEHVHVGAKLLRGRPLIRGEPLLTAPNKSPITTALAREGRHVFRCDLREIKGILEHRFPLEIDDVRAAYGIVTPYPEKRWSEGDKALCAGVYAALEAVGEGVARVGLCTMQGATLGRAAVVVPEDSAPEALLCSAGDVRAWWKGWGRRHVMLLNVGSEVVRLARSRTAADAGAGPILLARVLLLEAAGEAISASANERLLELAGKGLA